MEEQKFVYNTDGQMLRKYLEKIIVINKAQLMIAETNWASGITAEMIQGGYDMVSFYEEVLCEVASFLSERHFEGGNPRDLFSKIIHSKYNWYRMLVEPAADGRNGTMMLPVIPGKVMIDLKDMIANLVFALEELHGIDSKEWIKAWNLN
ncbi:MAG: hypothetical protein EOO61_13635 [Hymenobacter sp.]|nr:MAG: hypothetical protein EOO61_13635 [Hymenobacter sp.]